jgi:hypothetical protein
VDETTPVLSPEDEQPQVASWTGESFAPDRIRGLVADLIPPEGERAGGRFGVHVIDGRDPHSDIGRAIEAEVFDEFFDNDLDKMREEYGPYDEDSTFLTVLDYEQGTPVGVIRIIRPSEKGLKSLNDLVQPGSPWFNEGDTLEGRWDEVGNEPEHTVDISTMAVMPDYRSGHAEDGASAALYSTCVQWSLANGYNRWVAIVDKKIHDMMQAWGEPFGHFEGAEWEEYLDSKQSRPIHTELYSGLEKVKAFDQQMTKQSGQQMDIHGLYTRGAGLDKEFVLPDLSHIHAQYPFYR